jgi:hypothetical protein
LQECQPEFEHLASVVSHMNFALESTNPPARQLS